MRYVRIRVTPSAGRAFHPIGQALADDPEVTRERVHRVELLDDGTGAMLAEARGDRERYEQILTDSDHVYDYVVSGEDWWFSFTHFEPTDLTRQMIEARRESELMMQMPVEIGQDGSMKITYIGPADAFAATPTPDIDGVDFELLEMGEHHQDPSDGFAALTARQQKVLEAAVELGYYQNPREATHEDIADRIDRSPATVGEHLRKIESRVFSTFLRGTTTD